MDRCNLVFGIPLAMVFELAFVVDSRPGEASLTAEASNSPSGRRDGSG